MNYYIYRYQHFKDNIPTTHCMLICSSRLSELLQSEGSCNCYAPQLLHQTTRVKPHNVLAVPSSYISLSDYKIGYAFAYTKLENLRKSILTVPWSVDLSTIDINTYFPELFI